MSRAAPTIALTAAIAGVPDRHCERVVKNMLEFLGAENKRLWAGAVGSLHTSQMGNPVGQQRAVARFRRAVGDLALDVRLKSGRRGRCELTISHLDRLGRRRGQLGRSAIERPPPRRGVVGGAGRSAQRPRRPRLQMGLCAQLAGDSPFLRPDGAASRRQNRS